MTRTEKKIIALLKAGHWLEAPGGETIRITSTKDRAAGGWTTKRTVRAMVAKGLLTNKWKLPE